MIRKLGLVYPLVLALAAIPLACPSGEMVGGNTGSGNTTGGGNTTGAGSICGLTT